MGREDPVELKRLIAKTYFGNLSLVGETLKDNYLLKKNKKNNLIIKDPTLMLVN